MFRRFTAQETQSQPKEIFVVAEDVAAEIEEVITDLGHNAQLEKVVAYLRGED